MTRKQSAVGIIICFAVMVSQLSCRAKEVPAPIGTGKPGQHRRISIQEMKLISVTKDKHIAKAIMKSKRPYLYAAIASKESDFRPQARGTKTEYGLFQVRTDIHGRFSDRLESQVAKAESVLEPLILRYGIKEGKNSLQIAIRRYNGKGKKAEAYSRDVIKIARRIGGDDWYKTKEQIEFGERAKRTGN